jgi:DNA-binding transcriptional regulator YiaG
MTRDDYRKLREQLGTQEQVARALGVTSSTVARREQGKVPVTREHEYALYWVAWKGGKLPTLPPVRKRTA